MNKIYTIFFVLLFFSFEGKGQDVHYAQFHNAPLYQSPAMTGVMPADYRISGIYRSQWESVPVQYRTFGAGFDMKILESKNGVLGGGLQLNRDKAGDSELSLTSLMLSVAYTIKLGKKSLATLGANIGGAQRSFNPNNLTFDSQFNGDIYVPNSSTGETFSNTNYTYLDAGVDLNQPEQAFREENNSKLSARISAYFNSSFQMNGKSDILLRALMHQQNTYQEYDVGLGWRYHLSFKKSKETSLALSAHYRLGDAIIPMLEIEYGSWKAGLSYDINTSAFDRATDNRGGAELAIIYTITKVKPLPEYKACPIF